MMENAVASIIKMIPCDVLFDTHAVIECLWRDYSDIYLASYSHGSTHGYHGYIGQIVDSFSGREIVKTGESWSMNVHGEFSKCTCWKKTDHETGDRGA